jgi:hypothetical protein
LLLSSVSRRVDGKQHGEGNTASNKTNESKHLEKSKVEVSIEGLVIEHELVGDVLERCEPTESAIWKRLRFLSANR